MTFAGGAEIVFIALLAFIIVGPKDLPKILFTLGRIVKSLRDLSREFMEEFEALHPHTDTEKPKSRPRKRSSKK